MNRKPLILFLLMLACSVVAWGQNTPRKAVDNAVEFMANQFGEEEDYSIVVEDLEYFIEHPINLNEMKEEQLERLHFIPGHLVQGLLDYRTTFGQIYSPYELVAVDGMTEELLQRLLPFVSVQPVEDNKPKRAYTKQQLIGRMQRNYPTAKGYRPKADSRPPVYPGSAYKYYLKYALTVNEKIKAGFTAEKDPGEAFFDANNRDGFDFYSAYASFSGEKWLRKFVVGDYHIRMGQGLIFWTGWGKSKSAEVLSIRNTGQGMRGYTSADENRFLRGAAAELRFGKFDFQFFYSNHKLDASVVEEDGEAIAVSTLQSSGYHRTESELRNEKSVQQEVKGGAIRFLHNRFQVGVNGSVNRFDLPIAKKDKPYQKFQFSGDENYCFSMDHHFRLGKSNFFGEYAYSKSGGKAFLQGMESQLISQFKFVAMYRNYEKDFHALFADPFAESHGYNESGWYFGTVILPFKKMKLSLYYDSYEYPWLTYSTNSPSQGQDILVQLDCQLNHKSKMYIRVKNERKDAKVSATEGIAPDKVKDKTNVRWHLTSDVSKSFATKTRVEYVHITHDEKDEEGWLLFQDLAWHPVKFPMVMTLRFALFDTESYASRIYAYENDLLYNFSIPAFFGKGTRYYLNVKYSPCRNLEFWIKTALTRYLDQSTIGSGNDQVTGDWKGEAKVQVRVRF